MWENNPIVCQILQTTCPHFQNLVAHTIDNDIWKQGLMRPYVTHNISVAVRTKTSILEVALNFQKEVVMCRRNPDTEKERNLQLKIS